MFKYRFKRSGGLTVLPDRVVRTAGLGLRGGTHSSSVVARVATGTSVCVMGAPAESEAFVEC